MTESATPKPFFSWRRVIGGAVGVVVLVLVVALVVGTPGTDGRDLLAVKITGFQEQKSGPPRALVVLTNRSSRYGVWVRERFFLDEETQQMPGYSTNDLIVSINPPTHSQTVVGLKPGHGTNGFIALPPDGRVRRLQVVLYPEWRELPPFFQYFRQLYRSMIPVDYKRYWFICDQWIQCPKLLPDGTVEPPRLLSAPGAKP